MNLQQLKHEVEALSDTDRLELRAFLIHLARVDDPAHRTDISSRMERLEAGEGVPLDEFVKLNLAEETQIC